MSDKYFKIINYNDFSEISFYMTFEEMKESDIKAVIGYIGKSELSSRSKSIVHSGVLIPDNDTKNSIIPKLDTLMSDFVLVRPYTKSSFILPSNIFLYENPNDTYRKKEDGTYLSEYGESSFRVNIPKHYVGKPLSYLYCRQYKFRFNSETNEFDYTENIEDQKMNYYKGVLRVRIADEIGDHFERIADLAKLVIYCLSKINSSEDEISKLARSLRPSDEKVVELLKREERIKELIQEIIK